MKEFTYLIVVIFAAVGCLSAQQVPGVPNGSVAKDSRDEYDHGIRLRSIELEKLKRNLYRTEAALKAAENRQINYDQIKKDFEEIQLLQSSIIRTYVTGKQINYARISELAGKLNDNAARLDKNLSLRTDSDGEKSKNKNSYPDDVKDLIVVLDKAIGKFVTSPIFENLLIIEAQDAKKAEFELQNIIRISKMLAEQSGRQK